MCIRDRFSIAHIVHRIGNDVFVGSPYISTMLRFNLKGDLIEGKDRIGRNKELRAYVEAIQANTQLFEELIQKPDTIQNRIPIFYLADDEATIIETHCEETGWPNTTHEGVLMYENRFFTCRDKAVEYGINNAEAGILFFNRKMEELDRQLKNALANKDACQKIKELLLSLIHI